jgi:hypothetical protein
MANRNTILWHAFHDTLFAFHDQNNNKYSYSNLQQRLCFIFNSHAYILLSSFYGTIDMNIVQRAESNESIEYALSSPHSYSFDLN